MVGNVKITEAIEQLDEECNSNLCEQCNSHFWNDNGRIDNCGDLLKQHIMETHYDTEEDMWNDMDSKIQEIVNFSLLTDEQRIKALELAMDGYLAPTRYIHEVTGMSIKCSKIYYDLYIKPELL